jgi:hypothetical protein
MDARLAETDTTATLSLRVGEKAELSPLLDALGEVCGFRPLAKVMGWS